MAQESMRGAPDALRRPPESSGELRRLLETSPQEGLKQLVQRSGELRRPLESSDGVRRPLGSSAALWRPPGGIQGLP
eukprot:252012-Alexandrium_andersonii.AAC.1